VESQGRVVTRTDGGVAWIILDNPAKANILTKDMFGELAEAWTWVEKDDDVLAVVFTAEGDKYFCAGIDVAFLRDPGGLLDELGSRRLTGRDFGVTKPIVAAVTGAVVGGGLGFVADADIVVAAGNASFLEPHVRLGQICGFTALRLAQRIPVAELLRSALADRPISAARAHELGLVSELCDTPDDARGAAAALAESIARQSPTAVAKNLELLRRFAANDHQETVIAEAVSAQKAHWAHPDATEGFRAWTEKRAPVWVPRTRTSNEQREHR
jgi:enoyl-CoA hydratase/carnithine racemase